MSGSNKSTMVSPTASTKGPVKSPATSSETNKFKLFPFPKRALARLNNLTNLKHTFLDEIIVDNQANFAKIGLKFEEQTVEIDYIQVELKLENEQIQFEEALRKYGIFSWLASIFVPSSKAYKERVEFSQAVYTAIRAELSPENLQNNSKNQVTVENKPRAEKFAQYWKKAHLEPSITKYTLLSLLLLVTLALAFTGVGVLFGLGLIGAGAIGSLITASGFAALGQLIINAIALTPMLMGIIATAVVAASGFFSSLLIKELKHPGLLAFEFFDGFQQIQNGKKLDDHGPMHIGVGQVGRHWSIFNGTARALNPIRVVNWGLYHSEKFIVNLLSDIKPLALGVYCFFEVLRLPVKAVEVLIDLALDLGSHLAMGIWDYIVLPSALGLQEIGTRCVDSFKEKFLYQPKRRNVTPTPKPESGSKPMTQTYSDPNLRGDNSKDRATDNAGPSSYGEQSSGGQQALDWMSYESKPLPTPPSSSPSNADSKIDKPFSS